MDPIQEQVSIDTAQQQDIPTVSIDTQDTSTQIPSTQTALMRAAKASFGLYPKYTDQDQDQLFQLFLSGGEDGLRNTVASKMDAEKSWKARDILTDLASRSGGNIDGHTVRGVLSTLYNTTDPESVIEKAYADRFAAHLPSAATKYDIPAYQDVSQTQPEWTDTANKFARDVIQYSQYASKGLEDADSALKKQSYLGWGVDQLKDMFPGYSSLKTRGMTPGVGFFTSDGWGLGANWREQVAKAYSMPFPQFKDWYDSNLTRLKNDNPGLAVSFANAVMGMSTSDEIWNTLTTDVADLSVLPAGKILRTGLRATGILASAGRDLTRASLGMETAKVAASAGAGDLRTAAVTKATEAFLDSVKANAPVNTRKALDALPTAYKPMAQDIVAEAGNYGQEAANRLALETEQLGGKVLGILAEMQKVLRTPELIEAIKSGSFMDALKAYADTKYMGVKNAILNVTTPTYNELGWWDYAVHLGNYKGEYFFNYNTAKNFADVNRIKDFSIESKGSGLGYYIRTNHILDEDAPFVTKTFGTTTTSEPPTRGLNAWFNALAGKWRTPEETLSLDQRRNRHAATYGPAVLLKMARDEIVDIQKLSSWALPGTTKRQKWDQWKQVIDFAREDRDPLTGERGYFKRSPAEVEAHYQTKFQRPPDPQEIKAYFAYTRFVEMDRILRNLNLYKVKATWGAEQHRIFLTDKAGSRVFSDWFEGKVISSLPRNDDRILIATRSKKGSEDVKWADNINTSFRQELEQGIKDGRFRVYEIYDPDAHPFDSWSKKVANKPGRIRYVVTDKAETQGLSFDQVPRRGGGHFDFEAEHYIKQAQIVPMQRFREGAQASFRHLYKGDTTVFALGNRGVGLKLIPKMEEARKLLQAGKTDEARAVINGSNLPFDFQEFHGWFLPHKGPDGILHAPRLNMTEEFRVVAKNKLIVDSDENAMKFKYGNTFEDGTRKGSAARQHQIQYTGERDVDVLKSVHDEGTKSNPLFKYEDAKLIDPLTSINKAFTRIINSTLMDDYKIFSVNHWLKEAEPHISQDKAGQVWDSPFWFFNKANDKTMFNPSADPAIVNQLLTRRAQIQQFMGMPSTTDNILHSAAQHMADSIYEKFGPTRLDPSWMIPKLSDPFRFLRAVTFHAKLGLFSIPQLLVQTQTFVNILSLAGLRYTSSGTMGAFMHQLSRLNKNPAILSKLDELATKMVLPGMERWKPGEFLEAMAELSKTGFEHVGGEFALRDDVMNPKLINFGAKQFLDWGTVFFREGEKMNRLGAWYTSYREFRSANPTGRITQLDRQKILSRADELTVNMSRASSSTLHQGAFSIPTQFLSYQMRLAELFMGKRMGTGWQGAKNRMRMAAWYGGIYGMPTAFGLSGFPFGDYVRKAALDHGYEVGQNWLTSAMMEGLPSMIGALITGNGDIKKGTFYNIGDRYGVQGFETLREALRSDTTIWNILGGAAWSTLSNTYAQADGFTNAMLSFLRDDDKYFPLTQDDFVDLFREISAVHNNWRMIMALNTGRWLSKKGAKLDTTSPANAIFMSVSGLQPQEVSDVNLKGQIETDQKAREKYAEQKFTTEFRKAIRTRDENPTQSNQYMRRALAYFNILDYPQEKRGSAIAQASQDYESLIEQMNWRFDIKDAPDSRKVVRAQTFKYQQQRQELRGQ